jgi:hypothetical protein
MGAGLLYAAAIARQMFQEILRLIAELSYGRSHQR